MNATDIVGYAYQADVFHPRCLPDAFSAPGNDIDEVEANIVRYGFYELDLDSARTDPEWKSSETIPQAILAGPDNLDLPCGGCGDALKEG